MCDAQQLMLMDRVDFDCDGLIEIDSLNDLNNIRYNLAGTSSKTASTPAGADGNTNGCPMVAPDGNGGAEPSPTCHGYELTTDLDFDVILDGRIDEKDGALSWGEGEEAGKGWKPIGEDGVQFTATFDGNSYTIANLFINRSSKSFIGLFGNVGSGGEIRNLGVIDAEVSGNNHVGGLVGRSDGTITASYALAIALSTGNQVGGLVGRSDGAITASYAVATVEGSSQAGGLVGISNGTITESYALAMVLGSSIVGGLVGSNNIGDLTESYALAVVSESNQAGGLVGNDTGTITKSYFDADVAGLTTSDKQSQTTGELQMPTADNKTEIYSTWDDARWDFGSKTQYPGLKLPQRADGLCPAAASANVMIEAMGNQCIHRPVAWLAFGAVAADDSGRLNADHITNNRKPRLTAQMTFLPANSAVRLKSASTEVSTTTDANGSFTVSVGLVEGRNVFEAFATRPGAETEIGPLGTLTITLDTTSPTVTVFRVSRGIGARADDANPDSIAYGILDTASEPPQLCDTSFDAAMSYTHGEVLPARNAQSEAIEYCFVATDLAGNQAAGSLPSALRLRLRVFLESALP